MQWVLSECMRPLARASSNPFSASSLHDACERIIIKYDTSISRTEASGSYYSIRLSVELSVSSLLLGYRLKKKKKNPSLRAHEGRRIVERVRSLRTTLFRVESLLARIYKLTQTIMGSPTSFPNYTCGA